MHCPPPGTGHIKPKLLHGDCFRVKIGHDPALIDKAGGGPGADKDRLRAFHDELYQGYCAAFGSSRNAMLRMKEVWFYLIHLFGDSQRHAKAIRKARDTGEYESAVTAVFRELELLPELRPEW